MRNYMNLNNNLKRSIFLFFICFSFYFAYSQIIPVGSGSYTKTLVNGWPIYTNQPKVNGNMVGKPVPTNAWWSQLVASAPENHGFPFYNYPLSYQSRTSGLGIEYTMPSGGDDNRQPMSPVYPLTVGVIGLNTSQSSASDFSDWTVTASWNDGSHDFKAIIGMGMPFTYFEKGSSDVASVTVNSGSVTIQGELLIITGAMYDANYAVYAPTGSSWSQSGSTYTSTLNGNNY